MTCVGEYDDGKGGECIDRTCPLKYANSASVCNGIAFDEVCHYEDYQIGN